MINRRSLITACSVVTLVVIAIIFTPKKQETAENREDIPSINSVISNSLSELDETEKFDASIERFMRKWELKGGSFALMRGDSLIYAKGYGQATDDTPCDVHHIFRVASVSKLITATAIMKLIEQERISLDSQVFGEEGIIYDSMFLDLHKPNLKQITVDHLLRHTAGFSSPHGDPGFTNFGIANFLRKKLPLELDDMVLYATKNNLRSAPGAAFDYSNLGYMVLTKVVEEVTHQSYESFLRDSIMAPIGCYDMHIANNFRSEKRDNEVYYYETKEAVEDMEEACDGSGRIVMKSDGVNNVKLLSGAGGWVTSSVELLRFVAAIDGNAGKPDILSKKSIEIMTRDNGHDKPIGWASVDGAEWLRSGSMSGTSALIKRQSNGYTWVFISNSSAWIGLHLSRHISADISQAIARVKEWPHRDLFTLTPTK